MSDALQYLDTFLSSPGGGLSDQNTAASLVRLQAGLREEVAKEHRDPDKVALAGDKRKKSILEEDRTYSSAQVANEQSPQLEIPKKKRKISKRYKEPEES
ncbi:MAG: hypothetical protein CYPHOPRED_004114, partial [Cyphobasidiales sp. Tagirdzhanova-0007]